MSGLKLKITIIAALLFAPILSNSQELVRSLRGSWKFQIGDNMDWSEKNYNDSNWDVIYAPSAWENEGFNGYDGYAWYRKKFNGADLDNKKGLYLKLGYIDDVDQVFINGHFIGYSGKFPPDFHTAYNASRKYNIPEEYINYDGENVIAIRVFDTVLGGGLVSGNLGIYEYTRGDYNALNLEGLWKFQEGDNFKWKEPNIDESEWSYLMAPGLWRYLGKKVWESYGWYRKKFVLPQRLKNKQLTLILGKIDDFDEVYINGVLIGETNDGERYGNSWSYKETRVYPVPDDIINENGENTIAVRVQDLGGHAGIYEGPLVLIDSQYVTAYLRSYRLN